MADIRRRKSVTGAIVGVRIGADAPVVVQSMTNTDTADIPSTVKQVAALARAGSELVRVTVNNEDAAAAVAPIVEQLDQQGVRVPIIGLADLIENKKAAGRDKDRADVKGVEGRT